MKKYNVVITPKAKKTAKTLFEYIADKNPFGAKKWIDCALTKKYIIWCALVLIKKSNL